MPPLQSTPPAAARRRDFKLIPRLKIDRGLAAEVNRAPVCSIERIHAARATLSTLQPPRRMPPAFGQHRDCAGRQRAITPHDTVAAAMQPRAATATAQGVAHDLQWIGMLQRLDGVLSVFVICVCTALAPACVGPPPAPQASVS